MVFKNLLTKELRQLRWIVVLGLLLNAGLAILVAMTYRYVGQIVGELPQELIEMLSGYDIARELLAIFGNYPIYIWSQWNAKNLYQVGSIFIIVIAATQFAGEVNNKTMGFYLSRPITRFQGFLAKCTAVSEPIPAGVITALCGVILSVPGLFEATRQLSIFYQMRAVGYFLEGQHFLPRITAAVLIGGLLFLLGLQVFKKMDY